MENNLKPQVTIAQLETKPEDVGYDSSRLDALDMHFGRLMAEKKIQCASYMLTRHGKPFANRSLGPLTFAEGDDRKMLPDSIFRIASITKMFTAVAIMKLCEDGLIYMTQPVADIISEFNTDEHKGIGIVHLLTHTSGICPDGNVYPGKYPYSVGWWELLEKKCNDYNWIQAALAMPRRAAEGKEWVYSSTGFAILGEIITRVSGMFAHDYIMEHIVKPLGMKDTFFDIPVEKCDRIAYTGEWQQKRIADIKNGIKEENELFDKIPNTGGGLFSTPGDLSIWAQMFLGKGTYNGVRILGRKTLEKMTSNNNTTAVNFCWGEKGTVRPYGLGLDFFKADDMTFSKGTFSHEGAGRCGLFIDPAEEFSVAFFTPMDGFAPSAAFSTNVVACSGIK